MQTFQLILIVAEVETPAVTGHSECLILVMECLVIVQ